MKTILRTALLFFMVMLMLCGGAMAVTVEQIQICMPQIDVYMYEDGNDLSALSAEDISAAMGGQTLDVIELSKAEQGIFYVYMLDVSASIPEAHFTAAKEAVLEAWERLRDKDKLALLTFGNEVTLLLEGGESRSKVTETLNLLQNSDSSTKFYNAMNSLIELVLKTEDMRRVAVVISDGIDDTDAGMTQEELEDKLIRTGVSVSAMCIDTTSAAAMEKFGEFIRLSGGEFYPFGSSAASSVLDSLLDRLDGGWHLELEAPSNIASGKEELLSISFYGNTTVDMTVVPERWTADDTPPRVKSVAYDSEGNAFIVSFSEAVSDAENTDAYVLANENGETVSIASAEAAGETSCRLMLTDPIPEDSTLTLTVSGLRDISMEQNEIYGYSEIVWSGQAQSAETDEASAAAADEPLIDMSTIIILAAAALLIVGGVIVIFKLSSHKTVEKKRKESAKQKDKPEAVKSTATFMFLEGETGEKKDSP